MSFATSEVVESVDKTPSNGDTRIVDNPYKLFLVKKAMESLGGEGRKKCAKISDYILVNHGIYVSPDECADLVGKYSGLTRRSSKPEVILTLLTLAVISFFMDRSWSGYIAMLLFSPLILNFYSAIVVNIKLLMFNPAELIPSEATPGKKLRSTAVILASRNEPFLVAKMTFDSAMSLKYPTGKKEIIVVDNSDTDYPEYNAWKEYVESFSENGRRKVEGVRVVFIHRDGIEGFKPRNLDMALEVVQADLMLYLDVDSTLRPDTLLRTVPMFDWDEKLGFVQLYTVPTNSNGKSSLAFVQSLRNYFLRLEMVFLAHASHSLFFGHNAVWRTSVVKELGECLEYHRGEVVVTEDLSMSFRARIAGYYGTGAWLDSGEWVPESLRETEAMWLRWTVGTYQVYSKHFFNVLRRRALPKREIVGWIQNAGYSINYGLVPFYAAFGLLLDSTILMWMVVMSLLPEVVQAICAVFKLSLGKMNFVNKVFKCYAAFLIVSTFVNWVRCIGLLRFIAGVKQGWTPTGKSTESEIPFMQIIRQRYGFLLFGFGCLIASIAMLSNGSTDLMHSILVSAVGIYGLNSLLCVLLFGKARMRDELHDVMTKRRIDNYSKFYLSNS